jgi:hypothetical protein
MSLSRVCAFVMDKDLRAPSNGDPARITHQLLTGGKLGVLRIPPTEMAGFLRAHAEDVRAGTAEALTENRSPNVFPYYADVDLKLPAAADLSDEAVVQIARTANAQVQRFFEDRQEAFVLVVCRRAGGGRPCDDGAHRKYGLHLHWPSLLVNIDRARELRESIIAGLERVEGWAALLLGEQGEGQVAVDWRDAVDASVLRNHGGLRMVGAPKASKCRDCHGSRDRGACATCGRHHNCHVIDPAAYGLFAVLRGEALDEAHRVRLAANLCLLLRATSVRTEKQTETPGYRPYPGCPRVRAEEFPAAGGKRKRVDGDEARLGAGFRREPPISDPRMLAVVRRHLAAHSPEYAHAHAVVRFDGKGCYRAVLSGEGATWCANKREHHNRQHVYMELRAAAGGGGRHQSYMRCWCRCPVKRHGFVACKDYTSRGVSLTSDEANLFFPSTVCSSAHALEQLQRALDKKKANSIAATLTAAAGDADAAPPR